MIFQRALKRELFSTAGGVFLTLFTITITMMLIRILGQAAKGRVASEDVIALIGFTALNYMPIILILTGFVSVLLVVTRSYQDSEMVVWFASGQSLTKWLRPVLEFALPIVVLVALLGFVATPWAYRQSSEFRERFEKREDIARISPGKFQESASAQRVFFVEKMSDDLSTVGNVFINSIKNGEVSTVVSQNGTIETNEQGEKFVVLEDGVRYDETFDQSDFRIMEFEKYIAYIAPKGDVSVSDNSTACHDDAGAVAGYEQQEKGGTGLAYRFAIHVGIAHVAGDPAGIRQSESGAFLQSDYRGIAVYDIQQSVEFYPGLCRTKQTGFRSGMVAFASGGGTGRCHAVRVTSGGQ